MKKILILLVLFFFPVVASAKGMMYDSMGSCAMHGSAAFMATHILAIIVIAVWGVVGILAAVWLWQHIDSHKRRHHEEK